MPIDYIDPLTGEVHRIPELSLDEYEALAAKQRQMRPKTPPHIAPNFDDLGDDDFETQHYNQELILNGDDKAVQEDISRLLNFDEIPLPMPDKNKLSSVENLPTFANAGTSDSLTSNSAASTEIRIKLPPNWTYGKFCVTNFLSISLSIDKINKILTFFPVFFST